MREDINMDQQLLIEVIKTIAWPLFFFLAFLTVRKPVGRLVENITNAEYKGLKFATVKELDETIQDLKEIKKDLDDVYEHEEPFPNTEAAFTAAGNYIVAYLDKNKNRDSVTVELKMLTIAMTFSWPFVTERIPEILTKHPNAKINIKILVADPDFLGELDIDKENVNWKKKAVENINAIKKLVKDPSRHQNRLSIELRLYRNLPHWHGLWINGNHLFLGRSDWKFEKEKPQYTVGTNTYRHFSDKETRGDARIKLFENWHRYYFDHAHIGVSIKL
jgi:hypothetical protein